MTPAVVEDKRVHLSNFDQFASHQAGAMAAPWLEALRRDAIARFDQLGFPRKRDEYWRHTNFDPIARTPFALADLQGPDSGALAAEQYSFGKEAAVELVFVNGHYVSRLSTHHGKLPRSVTVTSLAAAVEQDAATVEQHLAKYASMEKNPFVALNTGFIRDGAFIHLRRGAVIEQAIHLLFISTAGQQPTVSHPRILVVAEDGVSATVVETYVGGVPASGGAYFTNAVTEFVTGADCHIDHCKMHQESLAAYHVATMQVSVGARSKFVSHAATLGGRLTRNDLNVILAGEAAEATLNGLVIASGEQHVDNHTLLHHAQPRCPSHELYKHVLDGKATCVFKGQIYVAQAAQKTDSKQTNKSLLLSDEAYMNSQPALEIYADDVKCTHGSTTGPVDEEMVFYLRTRGVGLEAARHLLTYAFAADITRRIRVAPVRLRLEDFMAAQHGLPQDLRITDLGGYDEKAR